MRIKDELILKEIAGEFVVVPVGSLTVDMRCMIKLNETGAFLWRQLMDEKSRDELIAALLDEYEVSADKAAADVDTFVGLLTDNQLLS